MPTRVPAGYPTPPPGLCRRSRGPRGRKRSRRSSRNTEIPGSTTCSRRLPPAGRAAESSATRQSREPPRKRLIRRSASACHHQPSVGIPMPTRVPAGHRPRPRFVQAFARPQAIPAIVAEHRHPGIDDLQSSSSAGPRGSGVECNSTIPGTAPKALNPSVGIRMPSSTVGRHPHADPGCSQCTRSGRSPVTPGVGRPPRGRGSKGLPPYGLRACRAGARTCQMLRSFLNRD
jgi:hypothetical protein